MEFSIRDKDRAIQHVVHTHTHTNTQNVFICTPKTFPKANNITFVCNLAWSSSGTEQGLLDTFTTNANKRNPHSLARSFMHSYTHPLNSKRTSKRIKCLSNVRVLFLLHSSASQTPIKIEMNFFFACKLCPARLAYRTMSCHVSQCVQVNFIYNISMDKETHAQN